MAPAAPGEPAEDIAGNLAAVRDRIAAAAASAGRDPATITLVAVSKTFGAADVQAAIAAGQQHFGENRVQEAEGKIIELTGANFELRSSNFEVDSRIEWHLVGHLQTNKAKKAAALFDWIHSVDSADLLRKLDAAAAERGRRLRVLIQADLAQEASKFGADESRIGDLARQALECRALQLSGLMIIPPIPERAEDSRPWFRRLRELRDALVMSGIPAASLAELSMGMSQDFAVAIEEGATMVRIGTAIFGHRA
jgi:pyridoxal phosphate enzyme (YggS family)